MDNTSFWSLIGSVVGNIFGLGFIGLSLYYSKIKETSQNAAAYGLKRQVKEFVMAPVLTTLVLFFLPLGMALIKTTSNGYLSILFIIGFPICAILVMWANIRSSLPYLKFINTTLMLEIATFLYLLLAARYDWGNKDSLEGWSQVMAIIALMTGLFVGIFTIDHLQLHGALFRVEETFLKRLEKAQFRLELRFRELEDKYNDFVKAVKVKMDEDSLIQIQIEHGRIQVRYGEIRKYRPVTNRISLEEVYAFDEEGMDLVQSIEQLEVRINVLSSSEVAT